MIGSATATRPASRPSIATNMTPCPSDARSSARAQRRTSTPRSAISALLPSATSRPSTVPVTPLPVCDSKSLDDGTLEPLLLGALDDRGRQRMLAARSRAAARRRSLGFLEAFSRDDGDQRGLPRSACRSCRRPACRPSPSLERLGVLDQHAGGRAAPGADHDRHRRGQAERTGTGDDQHGDGVDQRMGQRGSGPPAPRRRRQDGDQRPPPARTRRRPCRPALDGRARALRLGDHPDDLRQHRVAADALGPHQQAARAVDGRAGDLLAGTFSTGIGSPLIIDSSTELRPSTTTPSTGTFSPGGRAAGRRHGRARAECPPRRRRADRRAVFGARPSRRGWRARRRAGAQLEHLAEQDQRVITAAASK